MLLIIIGSQIFPFSDQDFLTIVLVSIVAGVNLILGFYQIEFYKDSNKSKKYLTDLIANAVRFQNTSYEHAKWIERFDINKNGDFEFRRRISINYTTTPVYWYYLELRLIEGTSYKHYSDLGIRVINSTYNTKLDWVPIETKPDLIGIGVFLNPTVNSQNNECEIEISLRWAGAFSELFTHPYTDPGSINVLRKTDLLVLEFLVPQEFAFHHMDVGQQLSTDKIEKDFVENKSRLRFTRKNAGAASVINYVLRVLPPISSRDNDMLPEIIDDEAISPSS